MRLRHRISTNFVHAQDYHYDVMGMKNRRPIKLLVTDIDGCLSNGSFSNYDLDVLRRMLEQNERYLVGEPGVPAITYCTGRPQSYVECLAQTTLCPFPAIVEGGVMMFTVEGHRIDTHPSVTPQELKMIRRVMDAVDDAFAERGMSTLWEPGRALNQVLLILPPNKSQDFLALACDAALPVCGDAMMIDASHLCIQFVLSRFDKGVGLRWLCSKIGIDLSECAGFGDAVFDIPFLELCGLSGAPANADEPTKAAVDYVCQKTQPWGIVEFMEYVIDYNRRLEQEGTGHGC